MASPTQGAAPGDQSTLDPTLGRLWEPRRPAGRARQEVPQVSLSGAGRPPGRAASTRGGRGRGGHAATGGSHASARQTRDDRSQCRARARTGSVTGPELPRLRPAEWRVFLPLHLLSPGCCPISAALGRSQRLEDLKVPECFHPAGTGRPPPQGVQAPSPLTPVACSRCTARLPWDFP